jgi:hypothetical protein
MRTTIELPDDLMIAAKKLAVELRVPLRGLIEEVLREQLKTRKRSKRNTVNIRWITVEGEISEDLEAYGL